MITTKIEINGIMVGCIYAVNKGKSPENPDFTIYKFEYWRVGSGYVARGTLLHKTEEGTEVLIEKILHTVRPIKKG